MFASCGDGCRDVSHIDAMIRHVLALGHVSKLRKY